MRSIPFPVLREMSMTARSGSDVPASRSASATSAASPHTCRSGWREMRIASPSRTTGWSSTIRIRVAGLSAAFLLWLMIASLGQAAPQLGAAGFAGFDRQQRVNQPGAVAHDLQPHPRRRADLGPDPRAVVADAQGDPLPVGLK